MSQLSDAGLSEIALWELSAGERRRAALTVARNAHSAEDCRELLEALGLLEKSPARRRGSTTKSASTCDNDTNKRG